MRSPSTDLSAPGAAVLIGAGIVSAAHVGKGVIALPTLTAQFDLSLPQSGALLASFMTLGVLFGTLVGRWIDRFGGIRSVLLGLTVSGIASLLAPLIPEVLGIAALRALEGLAFLVVATAVPGLLARGLHGARRRFVLGFWGLYMPAGQASAVIVGPHLIAWGGWESLWAALGVSSLVFVTAVWGIGRTLLDAPASARRTPGGSRPARTATIVGVLLATMFGFYSLQYAAVSGFLPVALAQLHSLSATDAGWLTALVMLCNASGNILGGILQHRGFPAAHSLLIGSAGMLTSALLVFLVPLPVVATMALFVTFSLSGGLIPSTTLSLVPRAATPDALGSLNGLINQAVQLGSLVGPPLVGLGVALGDGWPGALWVLVPANLAAVLVATRLGHLLARGPADRPDAPPR